MLVEKIQEAQSSQKPNEVTVLILDSCQATNLDGLTDEFESLGQLSLAHNDLKTLKGFPHLKSLHSLNVSHNKLDGGLTSLVGCSELRELNLSENEISDIEQLEPLKGCANLKVLKLSGCPIAESDTYHTEVFSLLPQVDVVDGINRETVSATNGDTNGAHVKVNGAGDGAEDGEEEDEDYEVGLEQLNKDDLEDDDEEYAPEGEDDDDEDEDDEEDEGDDDDDDEGDEEVSSDVPATRGVKRKHGDDEEDEDSNSAQ